MDQSGKKIQVVMFVNSNNWRVVGAFCIEEIKLF